ncbi:hypothetical protein [Natronoarchaeum rubrum]|uniref:hypothetical protein n=1 Tax=Natronoarchaeum rubrum TaxID=755311 RepID=UPI0021113C1D|nr:hypothetical protein [Natronoarchaeum rubrum]HMB49125.1 hypothetical protein [Natronoarchaeum rubrum]
MSLDVDPPEPPELVEQVPDDYEGDHLEENPEYHRDDLEAFLREGAWAEAFDQWGAHTDLDEEEFAIARDLELFRSFDFFWDDFADRVGYSAPGIPEDWREREYHPELDSWGTVSGINAAMTEFGQIVSDVLEEEYVDWDADYEAPDDLPDFD